MVQTSKTAVKSADKKSEPKSRIQRKNEANIIKAALKHFSRHGFRGATLDEIAQDAGLSKPNLLYYFKTKEELYGEALNHVLETWLSPLESLDPNSTPEEALSSYIEQKMQMSRTHPEASRMYAMEIIEGAKTIKPILKERLVHLTQSKTGVLAKWAKEGKLSETEGIHLLFTIWAVTQHYADFEAQIKALTGQSLKNKTFYEDATEAIKQIIFHGVLR